MGLTNSSIGVKVIESEWQINKHSGNEKIIALAGNPNVGKSTVFNALTGMNQHTGNWPGKTVTNAKGYCNTKTNSYIMVDLPGTYSLMAHSKEEEVARDFICFGNTDAVIVVCDATSLERNLNLVLQTIEINSNVILCVNLMDEAKRKKINVDLKKLSEILGIEVIGCCARKKESVDFIKSTMDNYFAQKQVKNKIYKVKYCEAIESAIEYIEPYVQKVAGEKINSRWLSIRLLDYDEKFIKEVSKHIGVDLMCDDILFAINEALGMLQQYNICIENIKDTIVSSIINTAGEIANECVVFENKEYSLLDRKIDSLLTGKKVGYPVMILLLTLIFWITISGANYISDILSGFLFFIEEKLIDFAEFINLPSTISGALISGVYRVVAWVVSVMLPPMAIFFPLFTLLEDLGYLPRVAYNMDNCFRKCNACGKQSLTMCMGFGCNAAGVVGCRIIDSPRERLLAILTNGFVPCNGKFPQLIMIITLFFVKTSNGILNSCISAICLTGVIVFGIVLTFIVTKILSKTVLKGVASSFTLEMPPYRKPQIGKVIIRSVFDRTFFVLSRSVMVAAPAGFVIWLISNVTIGDMTCLSYLTSFLDPLGNLMGLDGIILIGFILGLPANEIVIPIILMSYMSQGIIPDMGSIEEIGAILTANGWNWMTAVSFIIFAMLHWPCSTTLLTIKKETGSIKWSVLAAMIPTVIGLILCVLLNLFCKLI